MGDFRHFLLSLYQKYNRRLNIGYLENFYQVSYLDLARRTDWLQETPLASPNGGTASFSLLYILLTILRDEEINNIMELGAGKSSILSTQYAEQFMKEFSSIDDDEYWLQQVVKKSSYVLPVYAKLSPMTINNKKIDWYECDTPSTNVDLLIIDGPMAYTNKIKYNRLGILNWIPEVLGNEFIIIVDDSSRTGERLLIKQILKKLGERGISAQTRDIIGANSQTIITTQKYQKYLYL
jgi:hypothetical protein